ncbi:hypothetical protein ACWD48_36655 [Streptomyces sp. NPDC002519]
MKLPNGRTVALSVPDPRVMDVVERMSVGIEPTAEEFRLCVEWLSRQPLEYQRYAVGLMRTQAHMALGRLNVEGIPNTEAHSVFPDDVGVLGRLRERIESGTLDMCRHVRALAPTPAAWLPWVPDKIRCQDCVAEIVAGMPGTKEDRRCDECGTVRASVDQSIVQIQASNINGVIVPLVVIFGICRTCSEAVKKNVIPRKPEAIPRDALLDMLGRFEELDAALGSVRA